MHEKSVLWAEVDEAGRLVVPPEVTAKYGLAPGARVRIEPDKNNFKMHRPAKSRTSVAPLRAGPAQRVSRETLEQAAAQDKPRAPSSKTARPEEIGGPKGPEPTRYGDWERNGICIDF